MTQNIIRVILQITIYSSILIIAVMSIRTIFGTKINSKILSFLWIIVLCRLLLPITIPTSIHIDNILSPKTEQIESITIPRKLELPTNHEILSTISTEINETNYIPETVSTPLTSTTVDTQVIKPTPKPKAINIVPFIFRHKWNLLFLSWLLGIVWVLGIHLYRTFTFSKKITRCRQCKTEKVLSIIQNHSKLLNINKKLRIISCPDVNIPVVYGIIRPTILLPLQIEKSMSESKLRCILLHEMCHIKRSDMQKNYLWLLAKSLYWFNPLVWFAYESYLDDVEISCDEKVLSYLNSEEKFEYTGSLIDVIRISQFGYKLPLTVSFCKNKSKIRKRVTNMLNPKSKSKKINLLTIILSIVMIIGCFTTACQPTKAQPAATQNVDVTKVINSQEDKAPEPTSTPQPKATVVPTYQHDKHWKQIYKSDKTNLTIDVDTDVEVPDVTTFPAIKVIEDDFNDALVDVINYFAPNARFYYERVYKSDTRKSGYMELYDIKDLDKYYIKIEQEDGRKSYMSLSDKTRGQSISFRYNAETSGYVDEHTIKDIKMTDRHQWGLPDKLVNQIEETHVMEIGDVGIELDKAKEITENILNDLNLENYTLTYTDKIVLRQSSLVTGYRLVYMPNTGALKGIYVHDNNHTPDPIYASPFPIETISIIIDEHGKVRHFDWDSKCSIKETVTENLQILPFSKIKKCILEHLDNSCARADDETHQRFYDVDIKINELKLGTCLTMVNDGFSEALLIPSWSVKYDLVCATDYVDSRTKEKCHHEYDEHYQLVFSAIDGKVIETTGNLAMNMRLKQENAEN